MVQDKSLVETINEVRFGDEDDEEDDDDEEVDRDSNENISKLPDRDEVLVELHGSKAVQSGGGKKAEVAAVASQSPPPPSKKKTKTMMLLEKAASRNPVSGFRFPRLMLKDNGEETEVVEETTTTGGEEDSSSNYGSGRDEGVVPSPDPCPVSGCPLNPHSSAASSGVGGNQQQQQLQNQTVHRHYLFFQHLSGKINFAKIEVSFRKFTNTYI